MKKCSEFSQEKKKKKKETIQTQCWVKGHALISNQMLDEEKTPTKPNPVSAEMDVYNKQGVYLWINCCQS